ncbi:MAG: VCBS domain-containing protein [Aminivibrio sp.]
MANTGASFKVTEIKGEAYVQKPTGEIAKLNVGDVLEEGDILLTGEGEVTLTDQSGGETIVPAGATYTVPGAPAPELADTEGGEQSGEEPAGEEAAGEQPPLAEPAQDSQPPAQGQPQPQPQAQQPQPQSGGEGGDSSSDGGGSSFFNAPRSDYLQDNRFVDQGNLNRDINDVFDFMGRHTENPRIHYQFDLDRVKFPLYGPELHERGGGRGEDYTPPIEEYEEDRSDDPRMEVAPDENSVTEDGPTTASGDVLKNDEGFELKISGVKAGSAVDKPVTGQVGSPVDGDYGSIKINADGSYTYELANDDPRIQALAEGETLTDTFVYTATDRSGKTATTTVTITIDGTNDAPEIRLLDGDSDSVTIPETNDPLTASGTLTPYDVDTSDTVTADKTGDLEIGGTFAEKLPKEFDAEKFLSMFKVGGPGEPSPAEQENPHGIEWTFDSGDEAFNFLPAGETIVLTYTVEATDNHGAKTTHPVTITITGTNDVPVAKPDFNTVKEDAPDHKGYNDNNPGTTIAGGNVLNNDSDVDKGDVLKVTKINLGEKEASVDPSSTLESDPAEIDGIYGKLLIDANGNYKYVLDNKKPEIQELAEGQIKTEEFTYTVSDGNGGEVSTTLTITVIGTNDDPKITKGENDSDSADLTEGDVNFQDGASGTLTVDDIDTRDEVKVKVIGVKVEGNNPENLTPDDVIHMLTVVNNVPVVKKGENTGKINWNFDPGDEDFEYLTQGDELKLVYTVEVDDGNGGTHRKDVTITIKGIDTGPVADPDEDWVRDGEKTETDGNVLKNDRTPDHGDFLKVIGVDNKNDPSNPASGKVNTPVQGEYGSITIDEDGQYTYTLDAPENNLKVKELGKEDEDYDVFIYTAENQKGEKVTTTITIKVGGKNDPPVANPDKNEITEGQVSVSANVIDGLGGVGKDYDPDKNDNITVTKVWSVTDPNENDDTIVQGKYGTVTIDKDGKYTYTLDNEHEEVKVLGEDDELTDVFHYTITDEYGEEASTTLTITIKGKDDQGFLGSGVEDECTEEETLTGTVFSSEKSEGYMDDPDQSESLVITKFKVGEDSQEYSAGDTVKIANVGDFTLNSNGSYTFTPQDNDYSGPVPEITYYGKSGNVDLEEPATLNILVKAVTDPVTLSWDSDKLDGISEEDNVIIGDGGTTIDGNTLNLVVNEDKAVDLSKLMTAAFNDLDRSEDRWFVIENTTGNKFYVGDTLLDPGDKLKIEAPNMDKSTSALPEILIKGHDNFSGNLDGIKIYLVGQDKQAGVDLGNDTDPHSHLGAESGDGFAKSKISEVTLNIEVKPVADPPKFNINDPEPTEEDTPVGLGLPIPEITDKGYQDSYGNFHTNPERLGLIEISGLPKGAALEYVENGVLISERLEDELNTIKILITDKPEFLDITALEEAGVDVTDVIKMDSVTYQNLKILPPNHSSKDFTINVKATSYEVDDTGKVEKDTDGNPIEADTVRPLVVTVTPVAEVVGSDTDKDGNDDLTMTPGHIYKAHADQNLPFALTRDTGEGEEGNKGFSFGGGWANHDTDEETYALLTPKVWDPNEGESGEFVEIGSGNDFYKSAKFTWKEGETTKSATYVGTEVKIPMEYLDTVKFTAPDKFSGTVKIEVQAQTIDVDPDKNTKTASVTSGYEEFFIHVNPVAGEVHLSQNASGKEDTKIEFLRYLELQDMDGSEEITSVYLRVDKIPNEWKIFDYDDPSKEIVSVDSAGNITLTGVSEADDLPEGAPEGRYIKLDIEKSGDVYNFQKYTALPPPHSSKDWDDLELFVETEDKAFFHGEDGDLDPTIRGSNPVYGKVIVKPVAEAFKWVPGEDESEGEWVHQYTGDRDGSDETPDLTMTKGHTYSDAIMHEDLNKDVEGSEEEPFKLNYEGFNLKDDWHNEDSDEKTYAILTPQVYVGKDVNGNEIWEDATDSVFNWGDGEKYFTGRESIKIPIDKLGSDDLTFTPPDNAAGEFRIKVEAYTVDYDEDDTNQTGTPATAISGVAWLEGIIVEPVADPLTVAIAQAKGNEDSKIELSIKPTTADPNEIFNVTLSEIPEGSTLYYGETEIPIGEGGTYTFDNFDSSIRLAIKPPSYCDEDFELKVVTEVVDEVPSRGGEPYKDSAISEEMNLLVQVVSVPNEAELTFAEEDIVIVQQTSEKTIDLKKIITDVKMDDTDESENPTIVIAGLKDGATIEGAGVTFLGGTGEGRQWSVESDELLGENVSVKLTGGFSGEIELKAKVLTTEERNGATLNPEEFESAHIYVTPTLNLSSSGYEDISTPKGEMETKLNFDFDNKYTDDNVEWVREVWIKADSLNGVTLHDSEDETWAVDYENPEWYVFKEDDLDNIYAQGPANKDGIFNFDVKYIVSYTPDEGPNIGTETPGNYELTLAPVTDETETTVDEFGNFSDGITFTDTTTTVTANKPGSFTMNVTVAQKTGDDANNNGPDTDGSEKLEYLIIEGVPAGMKITSIDGIAVGKDDGVVEFLGSNFGEKFTGKWKVIIDEKFEGDDSLTKTLKFELDNSAGVFYDGGTYPITVTAHSQDGTAEPYESDIDWTIIIKEMGTSGGDPLVLKEVSAEIIGDNFNEDEEGGIPLSQLVKFEIKYDGEDEAEDPIRLSKFTISLSGLPKDTVIDGMKYDDDAKTWSATYQGGKDELEALVGTITVHLPDHWNDNRDEEFNLIASIKAGTLDPKSNSGNITINPVTDEPVVTVNVAEVSEGGDVAFSIKIENDADGEHARILGDESGGKLYIKVSSDGASGYGENGKLFFGDDELEIVDGYYVHTIEDGKIPSEKLNFRYEPSGEGEKYMSSSTDGATFKIEGYFDSKENGAKNTERSEINKEFIIKPENSGYDFNTNEATVVDGKIIMPSIDEDDGNKPGDFKIKLPEISGELVDKEDGSEKVVSATLSQVPEGFIVYYGANEGSAKMASNTGGDEENGYTWGIPLTNGALPGYIAVKPPEHWSGKAELSLDVWSGEVGLTPTPTSQIIELTVNPVADGITINPTQTFGNAGTLIPINLNATMLDTDGSETVTLQIKGLGAGAEFFAGTKHIVDDLEGYSVAYSDDTDTYTISGITNEEVRDLYLVRGAMGTTKIYVNVQTVDTADGLPTHTSEWYAETGKEPYFNLTINPASGTAGKDTMLYTSGQSLDGKGGEDTLVFRYGETVDFSDSDVVGNIKNFEIFDLTDNGAQSLKNLSPEHVKAMTDGNNTLTIDGDAGDSVSLVSGDWNLDSSEGGYNIYKGDGATLKIADTVTVDQNGSLAGHGKGMFGMMARGAFSFDPEEGESDGQGGSSAGYEPFPQSGESGSDGQEWDSSSPSSQEGEESSHGFDWNAAGSSDSGDGDSGHDGPGGSDTGSDVIPIGSDSDSSGDDSSGSGPEGQGGLDDALEGLSADDILDTGGDELPLPGGDEGDGLGSVPDTGGADVPEFYAPDVPDSAAQVAEEMEDALSA